MPNISRLPGADDQPALQILHEPSDGPAVLYIHGATFPAALSVAYRIDGQSWTDDLHARGFDVWAFDFVGYGGSDRPALMHASTQTHPTFGRAADAATQIARVVKYIRKATPQRSVSIVAHSWGTIPAGKFAAKNPEIVDRLVLFGPIALRKLDQRPPSPAANAHLISAADQWRAFQGGVPDGEPSPIAPETFADWSKAYLATDPHSASRTPPAVLVPSGPDHDFADAWTGKFPYDPADIRAPTLIVRGEWDPLATDSDAAWLLRALKNAHTVRDTKLPRGAHRMHLETNRRALFQAVGDFLTD